MYFYCRNKTLQLLFRFQEAKMQRFARNILNHRQTFERPSLGYVYNLRKGSVPSVFRWTNARDNAFSKQSTNAEGPEPFLKFPREGRSKV